MSDIVFEFKNNKPCQPYYNENNELRCKTMEEWEEEEGKKCMCEESSWYHLCKYNFSKVTTNAIYKFTE